MKRVDGELESSLLPRWKRVRGAVVSFFPRFLVGVIIFAFMPRPVLAEPQGPSIPAGQATIQGLPGNLNITQLTDKLIINWQSFNIGRGETVRFLQPNALAIALNRVTGLDPSVIEGALRANGRLFLVNPNGIVFGNNASVNVGSLMATTLQISDKDFLDGNYRFTQEISKNLAFVVNKGNITAADGGFIVLMAPLVVNEGVLVANLGKISLNATGEAEISLDEGGLVRVAVPGRTTAAGDVVVSSALTQDVLCSVIRSPGLDKATAMVQEDGVTRLTAGEGIVLNAGTVSANGASGGSVTIQGTQHAMVENGTVEARGETGGEVRILAQDRVGLLGNTTVDASGQTGGGNILIGGDYLGGGGVLTARATFVCSEAAIKACAGTVGEGGRIIVWSDESTRTYGAISARGGSCGGRGGFVETSGGYLDVRGTPDISGINGEGGTWLLDPNFIQIVAGSTTNISNCQPCTFFGSTCGCSFLNVCQLVAAFTGGANVRVKTTEADNGSIALLADLNYSTAPGTNTLSLESTGNICIKAKITGGPCRVLNLKLDNCWTGFGTPGDTCISGAVIDTGGGNFDSSGNNFTLGNCSVLNTKNGAVVLKQKGTIVLGCNINACTAAVSMTATSISGTGQVQSGTLSAVHEGAPGNFNLNTKTGSASISGGFNNIALNNTGGQLTIFKANAAGACSTVSITNNCGMNIAFGCGTTISADTVTITENGTSTNGIGVCSGSVIFPTIDATKTVTITNNSANSDVTLQNNAIRVTGGTVNVNSAR
ncbi:MAG: filamentous hemagglutinin N-terminal domain-containing protein, partial [Armatimonadetes bacterium]|nr:filamentous hemagglutinin N-terminal domain-containing protein [Armatimonadota bacterium]